MIHKKDNLYYVKKGEVYFLTDVIIKKHTIVIMPTNEYVEELVNSIELSYRELKEILKGGN